MLTRGGVFNPRVCKGVVPESVTLTEAIRFPRWEAKEKLAEKVQQSIARTLKQLQELNEEFKRYHYSIVELKEDADILAEEQDVLDEFDDNIENIMDRLNALKSVSEPIGSPAMDTDTEHQKVACGVIRNQKQLRYMRNNKNKPSSTVRY